MMAEAQLNLAWPTPVWTKAHDKPDLNRALIATAERIAAETAQVGNYFFNRRKVNCFRDFRDPALLDLSRLAFASAREYLAQVYGDEPTPRLEISGWPMIQPYGYGVPAHHHIGSHLVAVYYCSVPAVAGAPIANSGHIILHDPRAANRDWEPVGARSREFKYFEIGVQTGMMLVFPGYVMHSVQPWYGREPRVCYAMNIMVRRERTEEPPVTEQDMEAGHG